MPGNQRTQFATGIATPPQHADWYSMHVLCIVLRHIDVKRSIFQGPSSFARSPHSPALMSANKQARQQAIRELIGTRPIGSQEELRQELLERGWDVTQSTLSRDMRDLRIARIPTPTGARYSTAESAGADEKRATLSAIFPQLFVRLDSVRELIVVRTVVAGAQPISEAIDGEGSPDVLGTIAGENTILIICRSDSARERVSKRLLALARR